MDFLFYSIIVAIVIVINLFIAIIFFTVVIVVVITIDINFSGRFKEFEVIVIFVAYSTIISDPVSSIIWVI